MNSCILWTVYAKDIGPSDLTHVQCLWSNESFFYTRPECPMSQCPVLSFTIFTFILQFFFIAASFFLFFLNPNFNKLSSLLIVIFRHALTVLSKSQGHFIQLLTHKFISTKIILTESLVKIT